MNQSISPTRLMHEMIRAIRVRRRLLLPQLAALVVLSGCASPGAETTASPSPTASETSSPSQATPSPSAAAGAIVIDGLAKSTVDGLTVRAKPGTAGTPLGTIATGQPGFVVAGPVSADGYSWYELSGLGLPMPAGCEQIQTNPFNCPVWLGWVAAASPSGQQWLAAATIPCPASPMNLEQLASGLTDLDRLACYKSTPIRFRGWWPQVPPGAGLGGTCGAPPTTSPVWLLCQNINYNGLVVSKAAGFEGIGLKVSIDPASGVEMPPRGQWVEVMAHLDDPAARTCAPAGGGEQDPVKVVLTCRGQLVVESVTPVTGPY